jgi:hypothetical protein
MNPIATGMIAFGAVFFVLGLLLVERRAKTWGLGLSLAGLILAATPLVVMLVLFR